MISAFFLKKNQHFFVKNCTLSQSKSITAVLEIFWLFSVFVRQKVTNNANINENESSYPIPPN